MISGINSYSLSLAMRTAERANQSMGKMANQIASGKKVASVKDDGAAYATSISIQANTKTHENAIETVARQRRYNDVQMTGFEQYITLLDAAAELALQSKAFIAGSDARLALAAEYKATFEAIYALPTQMMTDGMNFLRGDQSDPALWAQRQTVWPGGAGSMLIGIPLLTESSEYAGFDLTLAMENYGIALDTPANRTAMRVDTLANATQAQIDTLLASGGGGSLKYNAEFARKQMSILGIQSRIGENIERFALNAQDRNESIISSLTDADMGKVSKEYEMAQTRQQLAYDTVKNAIAAYGNKTTSLLNNVLGTQRSVYA